MDHTTRQMNQCESVGLESSHLFSCIERALKSENMSQWANVPTKSESRSTDGNFVETELMASRDACKLFLSIETSDEAEVYRQLVVEKINVGDITATIKLWFIGHQIPFCRDKIDIIRPISEAQTLQRFFRTNVDDRIIQTREI